MSELADAVDSVASESSFSGVVHVSNGAAVEFSAAYGFADRAHSIPNMLKTRFGIASGTKGLTALVIASLIDDDVTINQLPGHRSDIGDYFAEASNHPITDYALSISVNRLLNTEDFLLVLDGLPPSYKPGEKFEYCNSGFVVLALIAERIAGAPFAGLVWERVCKPAGMNATEFFRSDALPGDAAVWIALFAGQIVPEPLVQDLVRPQSSLASRLSSMVLAFGVGRQTES